VSILFAVIANALALFITTIFPGPPGITFHGNVGTLLVAGAILGLFNAIVKPLAVLISLPFLILTLGLFYFILNGILLWIASFILPGYAVSGIIPGIVGALVITVVNWALAALFRR
jgi:putative membrane protein